MNDIIFADIWAWIKKAPLPVVMASCLIGVSISIGYAHNASAGAAQEAQAAKEKATEAKNEAATAKSDAERAEEAVKTISEKIDKLIEAVGELKGEVRANRRSSGGRP